MPGSGTDTPSPWRQGPNWEAGNMTNEQCWKKEERPKNKAMDRYLERDWKSWAALTRQLNEVERLTLKKTANVNCVKDLICVSFLCVCFCIVETCHDHQPIAILLTFNTFLKCVWSHLLSRSWKQKLDSSKPPKYESSSSQPVFCSLLHNIKGSAPTTCTATCVTSVQTWKGRGADSLQRSLLTMTRVCHVWQVCCCEKPEKTTWFIMTDSPPPSTPTVRLLMAQCATESRAAKQCIATSSFSTTDSDKAKRV